MDQKNRLKYVDKLDYPNIEFPISVKQDNKTENQNNVNMNAFGYKAKQAFPIYESKEKFEDEFNLSLMTDGENKHYLLIKDFNMFMYHKTKHRQRKHFCMYCLQRFSSEEILSRHKTDCIVINEKQT